MSVLTEKIRNAIVASDANGDGYMEDHKHINLPGHDVQIAHERGSKWFTVFCDGDCAELQAHEVQGWIAARLRR